MVYILNAYTHRPHSACMLSEYGGYSRAHLFSRFDLCAAVSNRGHGISFHVAPFQRALYSLSIYSRRDFVCGLIAVWLNSSRDTLVSCSYRLRIDTILII